MQSLPTPFTETGLKKKLALKDRGKQPARRAICLGASATTPMKVLG
jgi:hypothetical protein